MAMISNNAGGMVGGRGQMVTNNAGGMVGGRGQMITNNAGSLIDQLMAKPNYLGGTVPGMQNFYYVDPNSFDFYANARNMQSPGVYSIGQNPRLVGTDYGYDVYGYRGGPVLSNFSPTSSGYQEILNRVNWSPYSELHYTAGRPSGMFDRTPTLSRADYNAAMRQVAAQEAARGAPMMAFFDPRYSMPGTIFANNARGLLST